MAKNQFKKSEEKPDGLKPETARCEREAMNGKHIT